MQIKIPTFDDGAFGEVALPLSPNRRGGPQPLRVPKNDMSLRPHITFLTRLATFLPLFATITAFGQQSAGTFRIAGSVTDYATGEPVVGANVVAYDAGGRPHGAAVGADGRFAFNCPTKAATLRVSMLGYRNETVKLVPGRTDYDIRLREAPSDVGEVVVTGFVDKKRESYTGATHVIQRQEIENMVHTNVLNIIQLRTPGFEIFDDIANGSDPNKIPDMVLRGRSSFIEGDQTNVPLFILDGTEVDISYVFDMPSDDIESISVLKDASATSFYGSKAANGVVVITTRPTQAGRLQVNYSGNFRSASPICRTTGCSTHAKKLEYERRGRRLRRFHGQQQYRRHQPEILLRKNSTGSTPASTPTGSEWRCARDSTTSII